MRLGRLLACVVALCAAASGAPAHEESRTGAEPRHEPRFEPPPAGSYELPAIRRVTERELLGSDGKAAPLLGLAPGQVAFVGFVYLSCPDACPVSHAALQRLAKRVEADAELRGRVRLVTVSFDPARDDPPHMARLAKSLHAPPSWRFLTAPDVGALRPVLADFGQDLVPLVDDDGKENGMLRHVLKLFLVDARGDVRNIYSTGFLDVRVLANDALTVLRGEPAAASAGG